MSASIVVLTGAGVSADSGLATFRGAGGLWEGQPVEEVATPEAWALDAARVWRFYQMRRASLADVGPNSAHQALARFEQDLATADIPFRLVTQNVDDLHERAGSTPVHMHGELASLRCESCGWRLRNLGFLDPRQFHPCSECEFPRLRPDIVWFGEVPFHMNEIQARLADCTHFLSIGTSGAVYPAAGFASVARSVGARVIVNSLDEPGNLHPGDRFCPGRAIDVIPGLLDELRTELGDNA